MSHQVIITDLARFSDQQGSWPVCILDITQDGTRTLGCMSGHDSRCFSQTEHSQSQHVLGLANFYLKVRQGKGGSVFGLDNTGIRLAHW